MPRPIHSNCRSMIQTAQSNFTVTSSDGRPRSGTAPWSYWMIDTGQGPGIKGGSAASHPRRQYGKHAGCS